MACAHHYRLSDQAWDKIGPRLPRNLPGRRLMDERTAISAVIHMLRCGTPWALCPQCYGKWSLVYYRWVGWSRKGIWAAITSALTEDEWAAETAMIDEEYVRRWSGISNHSTARGPLPVAVRISRPGARRRPLREGNRQQPKVESNNIVPRATLKQV